MRYLVAITVFLFFLNACSSNQAAVSKSEEKKPASYLTVKIEKGGVATSMKLPAQLTAYQEVSIFPKVNGYVKEVLVDIGSKVSSGQLLMVLEAPELQQAVAQAKEKYVQSKSEYAIDKEHYSRLLEASKTAGAISPLDLSTIKAKMEADSAVSNAEKANWQMQQTMLDYLQVRAPFAGVITERNVHPGALVNASSKDKPMLELKQVDHLRLLVDIPETLAGQLKDKDSIYFFTSAFPSQKMTGLINRKSDNINPQFRSERMEIDVMNKKGSLSPGMFAEVIFSSPGNIQGWKVPKSSVIISTERKYIVLVKNGIPIKTDVTTGYESSDKTEVIGTLQASDSVIVNPGDELK